MKDYIKILLIIHFLTYVTICFNISVLRQAVGFLYLTFVPGFLILKVLKFENGKVDTLLFSVGLSIALLMFTGLIMCSVFSVLEVTAPLSIIPLTITISGFTLSLLFIGCRKDFKTADNPDLVSQSMTLSTALQTIFLASIIVLGIVGALLNNTFILLIMIIEIVTLYALSLSSKVFPSNLHYIIIFAAAIALLFQTTLISKYLMGWDIHLENYVFKITESQGYWVSPGVGVDTSMDIARFESVLSITILPTIYALWLNTGGELIFKVIYPLIFSLVPLALYRIYELQMSKIVALLSVFFFMSMSESFFGAETLSLARQMIGMLFLVLSIFLLVNKQIAIQKSRVLFIIFGAALVVSHYALSYFYISLLIFALIFMYKWHSSQSRMHIWYSKELLTIMSVLLIFALTFSWYMYVSDAPLVKVTDDLRRIYSNFVSDLFSVDARAHQLSTLASAPPTVVSIVHRGVFYIQNFFIVIGVLGLILKWKKTKFESTYRLMAIMSMGIMILCFAIPHLATSFQLTRFYAITIIFLAPFFVLGGEATFRAIFDFVKKSAVPVQDNIARVQGRFSFILSKDLALRLVVVVLVSSFLFSVGFVDHLAGAYPTSLSLDKERRKTSSDVSIRIGSYKMYIPQQDVFSAIWLSENANKAFGIYADEDARYSVLVSYGLIPWEESYPLLVYPSAEHSRYAYLRSANVIEGLVVNPTLSNLSDISVALDFSNKIYSNGASEIYYAPK